MKRPQRYTGHAMEVSEIVFDCFRAKKKLLTPTPTWVGCEDEDELTFRCLRGDVC